MASSSVAPNFTKPVYRELKRAPQSKPVIQAMKASCPKAGLGIPSSETETPSQKDSRSKYSNPFHSKTGRRSTCPHLKKC
nr:hypothetical protein [uncultured bacterium]